MERGYLQISFSWLFAIIVGIFILALAIYFSTSFIGSEQNRIDTETAAYIGALLSPYEIGAESAQSNSMVTPSETRIYNSCDIIDTFGHQNIQTSQFSLREWALPSEKVSFQNKYVFSEDVVESEKFYLFITPFHSPFKVADIIVLTGEEEYCFVDPVDEVEREIKNIGQDNFKISPDCSSNSIKICFDEYDCDINVFYDQGYVEKKGKKLYFTGNLIYGAIFSDSDLYECQVQRVMKRLEQLSLIYEKKSILYSQKGCTNNLAGDLNGLASSAEILTSSYSLNQLITQRAEVIDEKNGNNVYCKLW